MCWELDSEHSRVQDGVERAPSGPLAGVEDKAFPGAHHPCALGHTLTTHCAPFPRWLLNVFHSQIESKFRRTLESKVRMSEPHKGWAQVILGPTAQRGQIICQGHRAGVQAGSNT